MKLTPWRKNKSLSPAQEFWNDDPFFSSSLFPSLEQVWNSPSVWFPAIDVDEKKDRYLIKADLPGLKKEEINVQVDNNVLTIEGERKFEEDTNEKGFRRIERSYGSFSRSIRLGSTVDGKGVKAKYSEGVLSVEVPKTTDAQGQKVVIE